MSDAGLSHSPGPVDEDAIKALVLKRIASGEATSYNELYGGGSFNSMIDHPRVRVRLGPDSYTTAAGLYQMLAPTWDAEAKKLGLTNFSPASQDAAAWDLAKTTYEKQTGRDLVGDAAQGKVDWSALAGQWPSLAKSKGLGEEPSPLTPSPPATLSAYEPSWRDRLARALLGDNPSLLGERLVEGILGSRGLGSTGLSLADFSPLAPAFGANEAQIAAKQGDTVGTVLASLGMIPGASLAKEAGETALTKGLPLLTAVEHNPFSIAEKNLAPKAQEILAKPEVQSAITAPNAIDRTYDVPYLAGSNNAGGVTYIDKSIPQQMTVGEKTFDPAKYLNVHEQVEHALMTQGDMSYQEAHSIALKQERAAVEGDGIDWAGYQRQMHEFALKTQGKEKEGLVPPADLYTKPYPHDEAQFLARKGAEEAGATPDEFDQLLKEIEEQVKNTYPGQQIKIATKGSEKLLAQVEHDPFLADKNWQFPRDENIVQEYNVEYQHHMKHTIGDIFPTMEDWENAIRNGTVEEITPEMDKAIAGRSQTQNKDELLGLIKTYASYPKYRNEDTLNELYNRVQNGLPLDMPLVFEDANGKRRVISGNTRMDVAFQSGVNPKVVVFKKPAAEAKVFGKETGEALSIEPGSYLHGDAKPSFVVNNSVTYPLSDGDNITYHYQANGKPWFAVKDSDMKSAEADPYLYPAGAGKDPKKTIPFPALEEGTAKVSKATSEVPAKPYLHGDASPTWIGSQAAEYPLPGGDSITYHYNHKGEPWFATKDAAINDTIYPSAETPFPPKPSGPLGFQDEVRQKSIEQGLRKLVPEGTKPFAYSSSGAKYKTPDGGIAEFAWDSAGKPNYATKFNENDNFWAFYEPKGVHFPDQPGSIEHGVRYSPQKAEPITEELLQSGKPTYNNPRYANWQKFYDMLGLEEHSTISHYTGSGFHSINDWLVDNGGFVKEPERKVNYAGEKTPAYRNFLHTQALDRAINLGELPEDTTLYRGTGASTRNQIEHLQEGDTYYNIPFMSTSLESGTADSFKKSYGVKLVIRAPKGAKALAVDPISSSQGEHEVILPRGQGFRVVKPYDPETDTVELELLPGDRFVPQSEKEASPWEESETMAHDKSQISFEQAMETIKKLHELNTKLNPPSEPIDEIPF